jgi:general secretion pathway protein J
MTVIRSQRIGRTLSNASGFTLVEMLVAIAFVGLLSVGIASAMGLGIRAWTVTDAVTEQLDATRSTQTALRQILSAIYPEWTGQNPSHVDFSGTSDEMHFISQAPQALGFPGLARFSLSVVEDTASSSLVLKARPDTRSATPSEVREVSLVSGAKRIEFSYYGAGDTAPTQGWQSQWKTRSDRPRLIRIEVDRRNARDVPWPTLIVRPMIDVDVSCEFDPLTRRCRGR